ncbi:unnamed protein product [Adineta steineri]|uniref:NAD(+)--protein-arginine ADP-ribosyltransferase n=3 Tax=Adineta steineri TaxID=433720 RepID=A0A819P3E1_9BILA|nr:unnamed protein product [Adineta steineri]
MNRFGDIDQPSSKPLPPIYGFRSEKLVSLETALEPIVSQIDELPYYIKIAKKSCHYPSEHNLSKDQSAAIYIYTMEWGDTTLYRVLNKALRSENRQALKIWFPYLKLFDTALDLLPTVKGALWRGISLNIGKDFINNEIVTWWSVNSCSTSVKLSMEKSVSSYTEFENENEVILRMGTRFRVKGDPFDQSNSAHIVHLAEQDEDDDETPMSSMEKMSVTPKASNLTPSNTKQNQYGITIAGGNGEGDKSNKLCSPYGICVDNDHQCIYIADRGNHRIVEWKYGEKKGKVVAGGNGQGNQMNQLNKPIMLLQ